MTGSLAIPDVQGLAGGIVLTGNLATKDVLGLAEGIVLTGSLAIKFYESLVKSRFCVYSEPLL